MKKNTLLFSVAILFSACNIINHETIKGNGNIKTEERNTSAAHKIKSLGFFNVELVQGSPSEIKVEADENLLPYIVTENENGWLVIRSKDNTNLKSMNPVKVYVRTDEISDIELAGSGNVTGTGKFIGQDHLKLSIAGSGDMNMEVNTPRIDANIAGSGNIELRGETKDASISIAGMGDYKAEDLKAENAEVHIMGSGNVRVFASSTLKVKIAGSGDVYYKGNPSITKSVAGSGSLKQIE